MAAKGRLFFFLLVLCLFAGSRIAAAATNPQDGMYVGLLTGFCFGFLELFICIS
jgi:hypothetical protein